MKRLKPCAISECGKPTHCGGYCSTHYARWKRHGDPLMIKRARKTHGKTGSPEYHSWDSMIQRCTNPCNRRWSSYGGRGINVCERWRKFEHFFADMGPRPSLDYSLDRINNDGDYEPSNCRWATRRAQQNNTRTTPILELDGVRQSLGDWALQLGVKRHTLYTRMASGWSVREVLTTPIQGRSQNRRTEDCELDFEERKAAA